MRRGRERERRARAGRVSSTARRLRVVWVAVASVPIACVGASDAPPAATVRDSSGVRIVEDVPVGEANATWTVSDEPLYRIGWTDDDPPFENLTAGALLPDGRAVIGDEGSSLLYWISPTGAVLAEAGGPGEGPGEIGGIAAVVHLGGDTVLVQDDGNLRVNTYADSELVSDRRFEHYFAGAFYEVSGRGPGGGYFLVPGAVRLTNEVGEMNGWVDFPALGASADLERVDTIVELGIVPMPRTRNPIYDWGHTFAVGGRLGYVRMSQPVIRWYGRDGAVETIARLALAAEEAGEELWDEYEADYRERYSDRDPAVNEERLGEARAAFGGMKPFFRWAYGDRDGNVWLSEYSITGLEVDRFTVVAADGASAHTVVFPTEVRILDIAYDRVLAVEEDDFDVQAVVLYALERGGG